VRDISTINFLYLISAIFFILCLKNLNSPQTARRGIFLGEIGMLIAVVGTLLRFEVVTYQWIIIGLVIGSIIGTLMAVMMPMTAMPQRIAISHSFGAMAATLVGVIHYYENGGHIDNLFMFPLGFEVLFGSLTITGSLMAFAKLQELVPGAPITYRFQNVSNITFFFLTLGVFFYLIIFPVTPVLFYGMIGAGLIIGVLIVLPIGGADMPVVLALLNSYAGLASAATGFAIDNKMLIVAGSLDGASGFILSIVMSKAMNRSFTNVLFGAVGAVKTDATGPTEKRSVVSYTAEDAAYMLEQAESVVIIPGYGMAVAQAQHVVQELANNLIQRGKQVRYAIHPVAGRMPGHMNVLLAEANASYDLLCEPEQINDDFPNTDVALIVGANDTVNPAARTKKDSPLYGMPILDADKAHSVMILKRSLGAGFAGEDNELFYDRKTMMVFGDAKQTLTSLVALLKQSSKAAV
jgi:H+-translocating NAD(P) transhydrogenase subunit beta